MPSLSVSAYRTRIIVSLTILGSLRRGFAAFLLLYYTMILLRYLTYALGRPVEVSLLESAKQGG